mmetsp:Transcript_40334/g.46276  ORF Transcript_40334/g.46276 Transcript_40334/m.46276 type:complete len:93 (+) Transcript_40334:77-355(+)
MRKADRRIQILKAYTHLDKSVLRSLKQDLNFNSRVKEMLQHLKMETIENKIMPPLQSMEESLCEVKKNVMNLCTRCVKGNKRFKSLNAKKEP